MIIEAALSNFCLFCGQFFLIYVKCVSLLCLFSACRPCREHLIGSVTIVEQPQSMKGIAKLWTICILYPKTISIPLHNSGHFSCAPTSGSNPLLPLTQSARNEQMIDISLGQKGSLLLAISMITPSRYNVHWFRRTIEIRRFRCITRGLEHVIRGTCNA